jgi:hypothetical protein
MSRNYTRQEGASDEVLISKVVPATLHAGFYAYVIANGRHCFIGGPHATRLSAELEAHDWIVGELKRRARAAEENIGGKQPQREVRPERPRREQLDLFGGGAAPRPLHADDGNGGKRS